MKIGTTKRHFETGKMIRDPSDDSLDWFGGRMIPELELREVDWIKEMPYVIGIYDYDPSELFEKQMSYTRIYYYEEEDVIKKE